MKKIILSASFVFALLATSNTFAQQGFGTNQPHKSAAVEIVSSKRGLLIPRVELRETTNEAPVINPATSLFVYNTATANDVTPGFYYWDGAKWVRFISSNTERTITVSEGDNVVVKIDTTTPNTTDYKVSVKGGNKEGQVLVTKIDNTDPANPKTTTEWVDPNEFVAGVLKEGNGIALTADTDGNPVINLGNTNPFQNNVVLNTGANDLIVENLTDVSSTFDAGDYNIVVMDDNGALKVVSPKALIEKSIEDGDMKAKTLTGDGITITEGTVVGTGTSLADVILRDVTLGIATGAVTNDKIADGAVSPDKMTSNIDDNGTANPADQGMVPVADGNGGVTYQNIATAIGKDLTTDGKILIQGGADAGKTLADAMLVATHLSIAEGSIELNDIKPGTNGEIMVTDENGGVSWKTLDGDVTGAYNATIVGAIQGTNVSAVKPDATNNVLIFDAVSDQWIPSQLTGDYIDGKKLSSSTLTVSTEENKALLQDLTIDITPATEAGLVLTTTENTVGDKVTSWEKPNTSYSTTNVNIKDDTNYSLYIAEIVLEVTLADADQTVVFPDATPENEGQTISIKIANTDENHEGYLNVLNTYGSMPYQGWIVKSNGSKWLIVGRN